MRRVEESITYYKSIFGLDLFEEMRKEFVRCFEVVTEIYAYFHENENEKDEMDAVINMIQQGRAWKKVSDVITEIEDDSEEKSVEDNGDKCLNALMEGREKARTPKAILKIIQSPYFMLDVLSEAIYDVKKDMDTFCTVEEKDSTVQADFMKFRRNGRKLIGAQERQEIKFFADYGYPVPLDTRMFIEKGKRTQIEDVVPNIFRLLIVSDELRKLYGIRDLENYSLKNVKRIVEEQKIELSVLEQWKLEAVMGMNLVSKLTEMIYEMIDGLSQNVVKNDISREIKKLLQVILNGKGVFCKLQTIDLLKGFIWNEELKQASEELTKKRLIKWTETMTTINEQIEYEYLFFKNLIICMIHESVQLSDVSKQRERIINYLENSVLKVVKSKCNFKGMNYPMLSVMMEEMDSYDSQKEFLYMLIQKEYMLLQVNMNKKQEHAAI